MAQRRMLDAGPGHRCSSVLGPPGKLAVYWASFRGALFHLDFTKPQNMSHAGGHTIKNAFLFDYV